MQQFKSIILYIVLFLLILSCRQRPDVTRGNDSVSRENLIRANKILVKQDAEKIEAYVKRRNWEMKETETGLWYMIYEKGNGARAKEGDIATIDYKISLLDGTECYSSAISGPKEFKIGQGGVESGLEEGILLLHVGDKARFIMPPHLAHGLLGDNNKIPARSIILYEVNLTKLEEN